jgi:hypothetical protein
MNLLLSRQHRPIHPQESRQVYQTPIVLLHTMRGKAKVALIGAVALLVAAIISSCGTWGEVQTTPTSAPTSALSPIATFPSPVATPTASPGAIFVGDTLVTGYNMGANTSGGLTNWVTVKSGEICMAYPSGQSWGSVFITVGKPIQPPRPGKDLSNYHQLSLELRGQVDTESVSIGIKDKSQLDDGSETKVPVFDLTTDWKPFTFPLSKFTGANLHTLYVVIEFVFAGTPATVCARNIQYQL